MRKYFILKLSTLFLLFGIIFASCNISPSAVQAADLEEAVIRAVQKVEPSVVNVKTIWVTSYGKISEGMGSGVIVSSQGWVLTNAHVVRNARKVFITLNDGRVLQAISWRADPAEDIAVVQVPPEKLPVADIGNSSNLKKGQFVIAIGNPWKFTSTVTLGCISGTGRNISGGYSGSYHDLIQTDAAINPGNSGGALADSSGKLIGINTLVYTGQQGKYAQNLSFAIPINHAMAVARQLIHIKRETSIKPWLGVHVVNIKKGMGLPVKSGVIIVRFPPNSPAQRAGLKPGDIILKINRVPVESILDMQKVIFNLSPGDTIVLEVLRDNKRYQARVTLEGMRQ